MGQPFPRGLGWIPSRPDYRDFRFISPVAEALPERVDLRANMPPIFDQGSLGSCTSQAIAGALQFDAIKQQEQAIFTPSRLFIYYGERVLEHTVNSDSGASIRDGFKFIHANGYCDEVLWPYDISKFRVKPTKDCYKAARPYKAVQYLRVTQTRQQMQACLAGGLPFVIGFTVYESFMSEVVARTGIVPMPLQSESAIGGHAILVCGYSNAENVWYCRNSWGVNWGLPDHPGYFTMPDDYLINPDLAGDVWVVQHVF